MTTQRKNDDPVPFTNSYIERAKRPGDKVITLTDGRTHGLQCIVSKGAKTFYYVFYRHKKGYRVKIGRWPETSLEFARAEAHRMALLVRQGKDPRKKTDMNLLEAFNFTIERKLLDEEISEKTAKLYRHILMFNCKDWLKRDVVTITDDEIAELKYKLTKSNANAVIAVLSIIWKARKLPPFAVKKFAIAARENLSDDWRSFYKNVSALPKTKRNVWLFMAYTGIRAANAFTLKWDQIDFDKSTVFLPKVKSGLTKVTLPLSHAVMEVLKQQQGLSTIWVFPSNKTKGHIVELRDDRVHARPHDTRRLFTSCAFAAELPLYAILKLRGDKPQKIVEKYDKFQSPAQHTERVAEQVKIAFGI